MHFYFDNDVRELWLVIISACVSLLQDHPESRTAQVWPQLAGGGPSGKQAPVSMIIILV